MAIEVYWHLPVLTSGFRERWPYGPGTAFHPDLAIELDPAVRAASPMLAPADGTLIVVPDSLTTCGVFLLPDPEVARALVSDGIGEIAFFLRTLDLTDLVERFRAAATEQLPRGVTPSKQIDNLKNGLVPLRVRAGESIALLAPIGSGDTRGLAQLEVLFAPRRGSYVGAARALAYARRLADPANQARRHDPMAFYFRVKRGVSAQVKVATAHASHPLFASAGFTRRGLIEVRQEYDQPFATAIELAVDGTATSVTLTAAAWGHLEVVASGTTGLHDVAMRKTSWVFTPLPSGSLSKPEPSTQDEAPFHWALQSIYMTDTASPESWLVPNDAPLAFFSSRNTVEPLVDGIVAYREMAAWMKRVRGPERFLWHAGWWCSSDFQMIPLDLSSKLTDLTTDVAASGAQVRVILWSQGPAVAPGHKANQATIDHVNALPGNNGFGILDDQTRRVGSHHQKFSIAYINPDQAAAFCGGIDINPNRIDSDAHDLKTAYHDTHAKLQGPAIRDFMRLFIERWNNHDSVIADPSRAAPTANFQVNNTSGDCYVQVTRTIPKGTHRSVIGGIHTTYDALVRAVQRAQRYIYIEDQYLVPYWGGIPYDASLDMGIVKDLIGALARIKFLLIVIPNNLMTYQIKGRRFEFLEALGKAAGANASKIHVYFLKRKKPAKQISEAANETELAEAALHNREVEVGPNEDQDYLDALGGSGASGGRGFSDEIYVHSKVWVVDDVYVKCGSMNFNRRGFTYDSEADFHAVDGGLRRGKRRTALAFRNALLSEHARKGIDDVPDDPEDLLAWWLDRAAVAGRVGAYDAARAKFRGGPIKRLRLDTAWQQVIDPDGRT
jgi:phosphatidylserine/phosphatidylglycerophosphate/cardiolipin synthase-like enzyme